jgi:hypothetical protein
MRMCRLIFLLACLNTWGITSLSLGSLTFTKLHLDIISLVKKPLESSRYVSGHQQIKFLSKQPKIKKDLCPLIEVNPNSQICGFCDRTFRIR